MLSPFSGVTIEAFLAQFERDCALGGPAPTPDLIAGRLMAVDEADDGLIRLASACCLLHQERQLRRAA